MGGILGILQTPYASRSADLAAIRPMTARLRHRGPDITRVRNCWREHPSGRRDHSRMIRAVLMLQSWLETTVGYGTS
jgi:asparagine synthase (glutamine-hydrolysing)